MFMVPSSWQSHCKSSPGSFDECRMAPSGRRPKTKPDDLGYESFYGLGMELGMEVDVVLVRFGNPPIIGELTHVLIQPAI